MNFRVKVHMMLLYRTDNLAVFGYFLLFNGVMLVNMRKFANFNDKNS